MKSALIRPCLVAAGLLLTYPLASLAAAPPGSDGDSNAACNPPEHHDFRAPAGPGPGPGFGPGAGFGPGRGPGMGPGMGPGFGEAGIGEGFGFGLGGPPPFLHGLHLTDEQQDKVFAIVYAAAPAIREQAKALRKAHEALHDLNHADQYDESRVKSLAEAAAKAETQLTVLRMRSEHEIFALLTPEQKKQLEEHRPKPHDGKDGKDGHPPA